MPTALNTMVNVTVLLDLVATTVNSLVSVCVLHETSLKFNANIMCPVCGALPDGRNRSPRENDHCDCPEGWEGINCNGKV